MHHAMEVSRTFELGKVFELNLVIDMSIGVRCTECWIWGEHSVIDDEGKILSMEHHSGYFRLICVSVFGENILKQQSILLTLTEVCE